MAAQDPAERFDLCDRDGQLLGRIKARGEVHRDGDWHRALHLWVLLEDTIPTILLQRRSLAKDTHPGCVDTSVAGHLQAGEDWVDGLREAEEEVGLRVSPEAVVSLGWRRVERTGFGQLDREYQRVWAMVSDARLSSLVPHPEEVDGLLAVSLADFEALVHHRVDRVAADELARGVVRVTTLGREALVRGVEPYLRAVAAKLRAMVRGDAVVEGELPG